MINNKIIFFMPYMIGGGVEKNLYIIANNFAKKIKHVHLITSRKNFNSNSFTNYHTMGREYDNFFLFI